MSREITFFHNSKAVTVWSRGQRSHVYFPGDASSARLARTLDILHQQGVLLSRPTHGGMLGVNYTVFDV